MATGLMAKYQWTTGFDPTLLGAGVPGVLAAHVPGYGPEAVADTLTLVNRMAMDKRITDIRAMAYMLATAARESKAIKTYTLPKLGKGGVPVLDKKTGAPVMRHPKLWTVFQPIEESGHGAGKRYHDPVKVAASGTGALITERDGDQFEVKANGSYSHPEKRGSAAGIVPKEFYSKALGVEHAYYDRGLVQITWWNSYASAGIALGLGLGLELLFKPERLLEFEMSYQVMTLGMLDGKSFANGKKCSDYFTDAKTDYAGARAMVNSADPLVSIVNAAVAFEALLMSARLQPAKP